MDPKGESGKFTVHPENTIEEAWRKIEANRKRSVIILDHGRVVGSLSDGDLRKAMLSKRILSTPVRDVMNVNFISLTEEERGRAEEIFREKDIFLIPVVDRQMRFRDLIIRE